MVRLGGTYVQAFAFGKQCKPAASESVHDILDFTETSTAEEAALDLIPVGQEVTSRFMDDFYPATITAHNDDGTYSIRFFDGFVVDSVNTADISITPGAPHSVHADVSGGGVQHDCNQQ
jgi:hypothetical protein